MITTTNYWRRVMTSGREMVVTLKSTGCKGQDNEVNFLEHVILTIGMSYSRRGDTQILLTSPAGASLHYFALLHTFSSTFYSKRVEDIDTCNCITISLP